MNVWLDAILILICHPWAFYCGEHSSGDDDTDLWVCSL